MKTITIDDHEVRLAKLSAKQGWKILHKLGKLLGPSIAEATEDRFGAAVSALFEKSTSDEIYGLIEELGQKIIVDGKDLDLAAYGLTLKCVKELLIYNFEDFFSPLVEGLKSLQN